MKGHVILDLDETLISAEPVEEYDFNKNKKKAKGFKFHDMDGYYIVFERPGLQSFLDYVFKNFKVSIWTAASKEYAIFIADKIILANKPDRKLEYLFFSYHGDISKKKTKGPKSISLLWELYNLPEFDKKNTFIIDDLDKVCDGEQNCIPVKEFKFTDENSDKDDFLGKLQKELDKVVKDIDSDKDISDTIKQIATDLKQK